MDKRLAAAETMIEANKNHRTNEWEDHIEEYLLAKQKINQMTAQEKREVFGWNEMYEDEEWKPLIHKNGFRIEPYEISQYGKVRNTKTDKILCPSDSFGIKGKTRYPGYTLRIQTKEWEEYTGTKRQARRSDGKTSFPFSVTAHQSVMNSWKPFHENLLPELEEYWEKFSKELKTLIRDAILIDHIDDNPWNAHVDNLRYTTWSGNEWQDKLTKNNT